MCSLVWDMLVVFGSVSGEGVAPPAEITYLGRDNHMQGRGPGRRLGGQWRL